MASLTGDGINANKLASLEANHGTPGPLRIASLRSGAGEDARRAHSSRPSPARRRNLADLLLVLNYIFFCYAKAPFMRKSTLCHRAKGCFPMYANGRKECLRRLERMRPSCPTVAGCSGASVQVERRPRHRSRCACACVSFYRQSHARAHRRKRKFWPGPGHFPARVKDFFF